jgi:CubicO group peptidase (beta-lactamase class C family)
MLLSHTSGFPNLRVLNRDRKLNINFEPGSRFAYSGEGIQLLQLVVETIAQRPLEELMQERVFQPLGMTRTSMVTEKRFEDDYANAYDEWGISLGHQNRKRADAAGSMQTENKAIRLSYGLGWGLYWSPYGKAIFKEGHDDGFRHYTVVFDKPKDGIVIMTNSSNGEGIYQQILETLLRNTFTPIEWEGFAPYNEPVRTEISLDPELVERLAGRYVSTGGFMLTVTRRDGHLEVLAGGDTHELFPERDLQFFSKTLHVIANFELDSQGRGTRMILHYGDRDVAMNRMD